MRSDRTKGTGEVGSSADRDQQLAQRDSRIETLEAEQQAALAERDQAREQLAVMQKRVDEVEADNAVLAKRVTELEAAGK
jgi:chromosome segregation ATPase